MTLTLVELQDLYTRFVGVTYHAAFLNDERSLFTFTVNTSTDVITATGHDYILNTPLQVSVSSGGTLPVPLVAGTTYYARDITTNTFKLSATRDGAAIDITTTGTGDLTVTDLPLVKTLPNVAEYVRKEVASYEGLGNRPSVSFSAVTTTSTTVGVQQSLAVDNVSGTGDILLTHILLIEGGTNARGNTTGTPEDLSPLLAAKALLVGQPYSFPISITTPYA